jgi:IclR family transcriptional regulator, acetate operon repressor
MQVIFIQFPISMTMFKKEKSGKHGTMASKGTSDTLPETLLAARDAAGASPPAIKAFAFLEAVANAQRPLSILDFSVLLNVPQPSAYRIVQMLVNEHLLAREPGSRRYAPGARLARLGLGLVSAWVRSAPRQAILRELSKSVGETCNFGILSGDNVVYLDRVEAAWPFGLRFEPGSRVPLHCTSMGKIFLSYLTVESRMRLIEVSSLHRYTANTITDPAMFERELKKIRECGISIDNEEFLAGVVCVAVPVRTPNGSVVAAIAVSAPVARMSLKMGLTHVPLLQEAAKKIEATLDTMEMNMVGRKRRNSNAKAGAASI